MQFLDAISSRKTSQVIIAKNWKKTNKMFSKLNLFLLLISINFINCSDVYLICDEFAIDMIESFCTISDFILNHDDTLQYELAYAHGDRDYYALMEVVKFTESSTPYIPENIFIRMPNLRELDVSFTGIESFHRNDFNSANNLLFLTSIHNNITSLTPSVFRGAPNISVIDLSHNRIEEIKTNTFSGAEKISRLYFSYNRLKKIAADAFTNLFMLDSIELDHNLLESIDPKTFIDSGLLQTIRLNNNRIVNIECNTFRALSYLSKLNLSGNLLQKFNSTCLKQTRLDYQINDNNISEIILFDANSFDASNNFITEIKIAENVTFTMKELKLGGNGIKNFHKIFEQIETLEYLDLTQTKIGQLNITTFSKLRNLKKLYLRNCSLENITFGTFSSQKDLVTLDISYNNLKHINFDIFVPYLKHITELYIDGNNLMGLSGLSNEMFPELTTLGLSNNHFQCSDIIKTMMRFNLNKIELTIDSNETTINMTHVSGIACDHNDAIKSDWSNFNFRHVNDHHSSRSISQQINHSAILQILDWQNRYNSLAFQEQTHQFYLNFIRYLIASIAVVCLAIVAYKFVVFYQKQKRTHIVLHEGFYRSAATLNSNHTDIIE